jgi:CDP-glycerol glycerophosphotransferase (TagB/SpsB family)
MESSADGDQSVAVTVASLRIDVILLDAVEVDGTTTPRLTVGGTIPAELTTDDRHELTANLRGPRQELTGLVSVETGRWQATFFLTRSRWNGPVLPLPSGRYRLVLASHGVHQTAEIIATLPEWELVDGLFGIAFEASPEPHGAGAEHPGHLGSTAHLSSTGHLGSTAHLVVALTPPLTATERGIDNQRRLEAIYRATEYPARNAVFFESFYGQNASCNPLGIDRAIREQLPSVARYWSVVDASVEIPPGAVAIIEGSELWWRIRGSARLLVVNDWLRKRYKKRKHQTVLQTWHGTPLKKIALSRPRTSLRATIATILESARWNILLAQNPHSARVIRRAYAFSGPIWQEGYPRNDILVSGDVASVRRRLGIAEGVTVLLYAPTWRDDRPGHVDHLDAAEFADNLGDGYVTLIRGHSRSLKPGTDVVGDRVLDVTSYPDVSDLFLVADALITDYSSVMFDYSVTGKPIFFFAPDLEHYREKLRGFYFDLTVGTPGPVVSTADDLITVIRDRVAVHARYSQAYANWQERFNPYDDGAAGKRIIERLIREEILD